MFCLVGLINVFFHSRKTHFTSRQTHWHVHLCVYGMYGMYLPQDDGFHYLMLGLGANRCLRSLALAACGLGDAALGCLDRILAGNRDLRSLMLGGNRFSGKGVAQMCKGERGCTALHASRMSHPCCN